MQEPQFFAAVYGILENEEGKILFLKRKNTGFRMVCMVYLHDT